MNHIDIHSGSITYQKESTHDDAVVKASQDFESILIRSLLNESNKNNSESNDMNTFMDMRNAEIADDMSSSGGLGLSQFLIQEWNKK